MIYVDDAGIQATVADGKRHYNARWSHLFCDGDLDELHAFAASIGMQRRWFQDWPEHRYPHYDLVAWRRLSAIEAGAVAVPWRQSPEILRKAFPVEQYRALKAAANVSR